MDKVMWFELPADEVGRAEEFYKKVFGWQASDMGGGSRMVITTPSDEQGKPTDPGVINGDISPRSESLPQPLLVIEVANLEEKIGLVESEGGMVITPSQEIPEMGAIYAVVKDTEGNAVGLWQDL